MKRQSDVTRGHAFALLTAFEDRTIERSRQNPNKSDCFNGITKEKRLTLALTLLGFVAEAIGTIGLMIFVLGYLGPLTKKRSPEIPRISPWGIAGTVIGIAALYDLTRTPPLPPDARLTYFTVTIITAVTIATIVRYVGPKPKSP
jgi:hypothetical protein